MTDDQKRFCRILGHLNIMPKWKIFTWKLWQNSLATSANLFRRGLVITEECRICLHDKEDNDHLFWQCPLAKEVWDMGPSTHACTSNQQPFRDWVSQCIVICTMVAMARRSRILLEHSGPFGRP